MNNLTAIKLLKPYGVFNKGEIAGFLPETAVQMIKQGIAAPYDATAEAELADAQGSNDLAFRLADLDAREAALAEREQAASVAEAGAIAAPIGAPPAQGQAVAKADDAAKSAVKA
jgi:hypothetical protein